MIRVLFLVLAVLAGCTDYGGSEGACVDDGECDGLAICDEETSTCREVDCLSSEQCALGSHCNTEIHTCVTGCANDDDCLAGEACSDSGACEAYGCRTTELDCAYGEYCAEDGTCAVDPDPHCMPADDTSSQLTCFYDLGGAVACWGEIVNGTCQGDAHCLLPCTPPTGDADDPCPRGTQCIAPFSNDPGYYCYGPCPFLLDHGF